MGAWGLFDNGKIDRELTVIIDGELTVRAGDKQNQSSTTSTLNLLSWRKALACSHLERKWSWLTMPATASSATTQITTASPRKQISSVWKSKQMLFCMLQVVNPITTGPRPRNPGVIFYRLSHAPQLRTLLTRTVIPLSPCHKQGSRNKMSPTRYPNGASTMYPQALVLDSPGAATGRQGMMRSHMASMSAHPPACRPICSLLLLLTALASAFSPSWSACFSWPSQTSSPKRNPRKQGHMRTMALAWQLMLNSAPMLNSLQGSKRTFWLWRTAKPTTMEMSMTSAKRMYPRDFLVRQMMKKGAASRVRKMSVSMTHSHGRQVLPSNCRLRKTNHTWQMTEEQSAAELARHSWFSGSSVRLRKKQAVMLTSTSTAHFVSSSSKKQRPSSLKLPSLNTAIASFVPSTKITMLNPSSTLQNSTPAKESNQRRALSQLAAMVWRKEHSMEKRRERTARKRMGERRLLRGERVQMRQQPSQKLKTLKSSLGSERSVTSEFTALSPSSAARTSSCFLISSFSTGARHDSTMDHTVSATTHRPTSTALTTNSASVSGSAGQSQTFPFLTNPCMAFSISVLLQTSGTQRPVKVSRFVESLRQSTRQQLQGVPSLLCSHSYFCPGLLGVMPEYITKGRMVARSSAPICPVMIFSTNYLQSLGAATSPFPSRKPMAAVASSSKTTVFITIRIQSTI